MVRQKIVSDYLSKVLTEPAIGFRHWGPHSWIFESPKDKIVVLVDASWMTIVHDGPNVVSGSVSYSLAVEGIEDECSTREEIDARDDRLNEQFLQPILGRF